MLHTHLTPLGSTTSIPISPAGHGVAIANRLKPGFRGCSSSGEGRGGVWGSGTDAAGWDGCGVEWGWGYDRGSGDVGAGVAVMEEVVQEDGGEEEEEEEEGTAAPCRQ